MTLAERIDLLVYLGEYLQSDDDELEVLLRKSYHHNPWFTKENYKHALNEIATSFLQKDKLQDWVNHYDFEKTKGGKKIGLILAGNIPLVGFHDFVSVFLVGHSSKIKISDKDKFVLPHLVKKMTEKDSRMKDYVEFIERLSNFDGVIATGSNNSARYFEAYFSKYPNIIRKNRSAIAVLDGSETAEELFELGKDIFKYFGLGCRNVSKLFVPNDYNFDLFLETTHKYNDLVLHNKYKNNFDYNYTLYILNQRKHLSNGCVLLVEDESMHSRIASLHYEYYQDTEQLQKRLIENQNEIQCVVSKTQFNHVANVGFGYAQKPGLMDYADGVDTIEFLLTL